MNKLSVVLAVYNEEKKLGPTLEAIRTVADEIVVVDGGSTDRTLEICRRYKAKIIQTSNPQNFHINKKKAIDAATGDWVLQLDADEIVSSGLAKEITSVISNNDGINGYWIPRKNYFLGRFLKKGGTYPDYTLRLYCRGKGNLPAEHVHEQAVVEGKVEYLRHDLFHYSNQTFGEYIEKRFNRYTDLMAMNLSGGFIRNVIWEPLFNANQGFLSIYFRHLGLVDGFPGFVWALFSALHFPVAYFKSKEKDYK